MTAQREELSENERMPHTQVFDIYDKVRRKRKNIQKGGDGGVATAAMTTEKDALFRKRPRLQFVTFAFNCFFLHLFLHLTLICYLVYMQMGGAK